MKVAKSTSINHYDTGFHNDILIKDFMNKFEGEAEETVLIQGHKSWLDIKNYQRSTGWEFFDSTSQNKKSNENAF